MTKHQKYTIINWSVAFLIYLLFSVWHGALEGPLTPQEIDHYASEYQKIYPDRDTQRLRALMASDNGKPLYMVNAIKLYDTPQLINGKKAGNSSSEILDTYTKHVFSFLLKHGSYPLYSGNTTFDAVERWGLDDVDEWSSGAVVRYRSMRTMMKMSTDPSFAQFHDYKIAAMEKTIAFPTTSVLTLGGLSIIFPLLLIIICLLIQLRINFKKYNSINPVQ
tara:strand:+ start:319 stop:978 length:660 start_codon:yes stop_codon:yes gene_type:complete